MDLRNKISHKSKQAAGSLLEVKFQKPLLAMHAATDSQSFMKAVTKLLHAAVQCDVVYVFLNYYIEHGRSTVLWGSDGSNFSDDFVRDSIRDNPHWHVFVENPGMKIRTLSSNYSSTEEMERCPYFKKYIEGMGMRHSVVMLFWNDSLDAAYFSLALHRTAQHSDFTPDELKLLKSLHPHIDSAYRRINQLQSAACARKGLEDFIGLLPLPTILVDWELNPLFHNPAARKAALRWEGANPHKKMLPDDFSIPKNLFPHLEEMRNEWTQAMRVEPVSSTFRERTLTHPEALGMKAILSMTPLHSPHFGKPSFVIRFEEVQGNAHGRLPTLTRLSASERELALLVAEGKSNQEIAEIVGRSLNTIKSELHKIFKKLQIPSRARLITLLR